MTTQIASPLTLPGGVVLRNRLAKSAMSERLADPRGAPTEGLVRLYERWGRGGAGLLITGNVMVDVAAIAEHGNAVIEDDRDLSGLKAWAQACGETPTWVQLNHPGRQIPRTLTGKPVAPSAVAMQGFMGAFAKPRALSDSEIRAIIDRFARSAAVVQSAGFAGLQIHAAHGYLISQFLSPLTNLRTDAWGGSPDARRRFLIEIVRAVRAAVGPSFPIGVKLNSADFQRGGFDQTESMAVVEALDAERIDLLEVSGGTYETAVMFAEQNAAGASTRRREAFFLEYAHEVRSRTRIPLMVTGGFRSAAAMEEAVVGGAVDVVGLARPFARTPDLPAQLLSGRIDAAPAVTLRTGLKSLDSVIQGSWYQLQIHRMAAGLDPDPALSKWRAALSYLSLGKPSRSRTSPARFTGSTAPEPSGTGP